MDQLDINLFNAWDRVYELCRRDPVEARRRYERVRPGAVLDRPCRAWCVGLRASDTRLMQGVGDREPVVGGESQDLKRWMRGMPLLSSGREPGAGAYDGEEDVCGSGGGCFDPDAPPDWDDDPARAQVAHEIIVDGELMRRLGGPVRIAHPGVPLKEAAALLGKKDPASLGKWLPVKIGKTVAEKERATRGVGRGERRWAEFYARETGRGVLNVRYVPAGAAGRKAGMEVPVVWCDHALDPGAFMGRPPFWGWGSMWESLAKRIPMEFEQLLVREPVFQPYLGGQRFRGWVWRCPGLSQGVGSRPSGVGIEADPSPRPSPQGEGARQGSFRGCGRLVRTLYAPLPVRTIGAYRGIEDGLEVEGLSRRWRPGVDDRWAGRRRLACERCWRIKRQTYTNSTGWNELVSYLSGGLLYGHEVEKPDGFAYERRRPRKPRKSRKAR